MPHLKKWDVSSFLIDECPYDKDNRQQSYNKGSDSYRAGENVAQDIREGNF
jgi:hypothetical protein